MNVVKMTPRKGIGILLIFLFLQTGVFSQRLEGYPKPILVIYAHGYQPGELHMPEYKELGRRIGTLLDQIFTQGDSHDLHIVDMENDHLIPNPDNLVNSVLMLKWPSRKRKKSIYMDLVAVFQRKCVNIDLSKYRIIFIGHSRGNVLLRHILDLLNHYEDIEISGICIDSHPIFNDRRKHKTSKVLEFPSDIKVESFYQRVRFPKGNLISGDSVRNQEISEEQLNIFKSKNENITHLRKKTESGTYHSMLKWYVILNELPKILLKWKALTD